MPQSGGSSSSGFRPARNVGQAEFDYNGAGQVGAPTTPVALTYSLGATGLVDLTTPAAPTIVTAGTYAFTVSCAAATDADVVIVRLLLDNNFYSINTYSGTDNITEPKTGLCAVWFCDAADPFALYIQAARTGVAVNVAAAVYIQRLT